MILYLISASTILSVLAIFSFKGELALAARRNPLRRVLVTVHFPQPNSVTRLQRRSLAVLGFLYFFNSISAQTPSDAIMMPAGRACLLLSYDYGSFDQYWEGSRLRKNETIATVHRTTTMPMIALGITDRMNFYLGTPYVTAASTEPNGGHLAGVNGFQDLGLALKYQWVKHESNKGALTAFTTLGFSTPMTNYLSDYMPYSLGFGAPELSLRGIAQYKFNMGLYFRGGLAWMWRGYTEAERDYYYNNGSQYSAWMDVPNAWNIDGAAGIWLLNNTLKLEINYSGVKSTSGDDIRAYNAAQPTNKVMFDRVGASAQYYLPGRTGLGFVVYHSEVLEGRNAAKINNTGAGLTWQFNVLKKKNKQ